MGETSGFLGTPLGCLFSTQLLPAFVEVFAIGSFGDKILPANEMRRLIKLRLGLSLAPASVGGNLQEQFKACHMDRKGGFAKVIEKKRLFLLLYLRKCCYYLNY